MMDQAAVLSANERFYAAFAACDVDALDALWSHKTPVACVHPGWAPLFGRDAVIESWATILSGPGAPAISCHDPRPNFLSESICHVICYELIERTALVATNIFVKEQNHWRLVLHHATPVAAPPFSISEGPGRLQ